MSEGIARGQIKSIIERVERLEEEIKALNDDKSGIYQEAKSNGLDVKVLKRIVARRRKDPSEMDEQDVLFDLYMNALTGQDEVGTDHARVHAHDSGVRP